VIKSSVFAAAAVALCATWTGAASAQTLGIPVCDEFLTRYETCIAKMPTEQQAAFKSSLEQMRNGWKGMAGNPQTKAGLENMCKQMTDNMKTAMASYNCQW
jgi:hypothetical protein